MGWERTRYEAHCTACNREGVCIQGSDDWGRTSTDWEGFSSQTPTAAAVARKRVDARDKQAVCVCGSTSIEVGSRLEN